MAIFAFSLLAASGGCGAGGSYERLSGNGGGDVGAGGDATTGSGGETPGSGGAGGNGAVTGTGGAATGGVVGAGGQASGGSAGGGASGVAGHGGAVAGTGTGGSAGAPVGAGGQIVASGGATGTGGVVATGGAGGSVVATGGAAGGGAPGGVGTGGAAGGAPGMGGMAGGPAQRILSIDFVGGVVSSAGGAGGATITPVPMAATEVAGVKPAANWNAASGSASAAPLTPLRLADGSSFAASVTWSQQGTPSVYGVGFADVPGDVRMMNGYLDPVSTTAVVNPVVTVTVSGLGSLTGGYDVYVYSFGSINNTDTRSRKLAIGTANFTVSQKGPSPTTFSGYVLGTSGNYVVFKQVTGASFTLTSTAVAGLTKRAPVNGLQIVWPSAP